MRTVSLYLVLAFVVLLSSCGKEGKVIPRDKLSKIYAEMFIADRKIDSDWDARRMADTMFVYSPIFEKYGYTVEDYRASMAHYIQDPDRYARILRNSASIIEAEIKALKKEKELIEAMEKLKDEVSSFAPDRIFRLTGLENPYVFVEDSLCFFVDSTGGKVYFDVREWMDTAYYGPEMRFKKEDTLATVDSVVVEEPVETPESPLIQKGQRESGKQEMTVPVRERATRLLDAAEAELN